MFTLICEIIKKYKFVEYIEIETHVNNYINPKITIYDFLLQPKILQLSDKYPYNGLKIKGNKMMDV